MKYYLKFKFAKITFSLCKLYLKNGLLSQLKEVPESVFLQETVDENQLVHVYSVFEVISTLAFSVFVFLMSSITEKFGITTSFWLSTICILLEAGLLYHNRNYLK